MRIFGRLSAITTSVYTFVLLILFLTVADQALSRMGYLPINPTLCAVLGLLPFSFQTLSTSLAKRSSRDALAPLVKNALPLGAFFLIAVLSLLYGALPGAYWKEGGKWIFLIPYGFMVCVLSTYIPRNTAFRSLFPWAAVCILALLVWSILFDMAYPGTFALLNARAAGFPGNANFAALVAVMVCSAALDYTSKKPSWHNVIVLLLTGTVVVASMSRSGTLNFIFLISMFSYIRLAENGWRRKEVLKVSATISIIALCCAITAVVATTSIGVVTRQTRLHRLMHQQQVDDGSAASRLFAVQEALRLIDEAPLLGHGTGHARTMAELPHNLYLQQWVNNGIFGILGLVGFFLVTLYTFTRRQYRPGQAFILVSILGGVFSHNILEQRSFLILLGILLGLSYHTPRPAIARYASVAPRAP